MEAMLTSPTQRGGGLSAAPEVGPRHGVDQRRRCCRPRRTQRRRRGAVLDRVDPSVEADGGVEHPEDAAVRAQAELDDPGFDR